MEFEYIFTETNITFLFLPLLCGFWLICAFLSAFIHGIRTGRPEIGCVTGLILGPVGIVVVLLMPKNKLNIEAYEKEYDDFLIAIGDKQPYQEPQKICPKCQMSLRVHAARCVFCGYKFVEASINPVHYQQSDNT